MFTVLVIALLSAMLLSLFSALYFLYRPPRAKRRMVQALSWRIGLALAVFLTLLVAFRAGLIPGYSQ